MPMNSVDQMIAVVAANVASLRKARAYSMDKLAQLSGVSKGMIVQIEQSRSSASVGTLVKLANALGVTVARLVEPASPPAVSKTRIDSAPLVWRGPGGGSGRLIAGVEEPSLSEFWEWRLQPKEAHDGLAHLPGSKEILSVLRGRLTVSTSDWEQTLGAREAMVFTADVPHRYLNAGRTEVVFNMVVLEPRL